jgi:hypothetical protein
MNPSQSSSKLYTALIIILGLVGGYIVYSQFIQPSAAVIQAPVLDKQDGESTLKNIRINFKILDDPAYKNLVISGESPVNPGVTGKKDIFAP